LLEDALHGGSQSLTLGVTDLNLLQLVELDDGRSQVHNVLAPLREGVESDEQGIGGDFPLVLDLCLVVEVLFLESGTDIEGNSELVVSS